MADTNQSNGELTIRPADLPKELQNIQQYAAVFIQSGMFPDTKRLSQGIVQIMAGMEIGLSPFAAMRGINIINGKPELSANVMATKVKGGGKYDYRVTEWTDKSCTIKFFEIIDGKREEIGVSEFTEQDARSAGLLGKGNWSKHPKDMYFARALSRGVRVFCPDVFNGVSVYAPGEIAVEKPKKAEQPVEPAKAEAQPAETKEATPPTKTKPSKKPAAKKPAPKPEPEVVVDDQFKQDIETKMEELGLTAQQRMRVIRQSTGKVALPHDDADWIKLNEAVDKLAEEGNNDGK